jgi:hypothetical protein
VANAWYPAGNVRNAPQKITEFHEEYPEKPGPPVRLQHWIRCALNDEYPDEHLDDGKVAQRD